MLISWNKFIQIYAHIECVLIDSSTYWKKMFVYLYKITVKYVINVGIFEWLNFAYAVCRSSWFLLSLEKKVKEILWENQFLIPLFASSHSSYSPDGRQEPPRWACFLCGLGLFIYQSLDAIDGKQARRTNSSSPLGELFDHGCDSISTVFVAVSACVSVQLGHYPKWMFFQVNTIINATIDWLYKNIRDNFTVFLCNDIILLCALANIRLRNVTIR